MKQELSRPVVVTLVVVIALLIFGIGWYAINRDTGVITIHHEGVSGKQKGSFPAGTSQTFGKGVVFRPGSK